MRMKLVSILCMGAFLLILLNGSVTLVSSMGKKHHTASDSAGTSLNLIQWRTLSDGKIEAQEKKMPMLVDFYTSMDCERCRSLDRQVYSDATLADEITNTFVPVRVSLDQELTSEEQKLMDTLEGEDGGECVLAFLNMDGEIISDQTGKPIASMEMLPPDTYKNYMEMALNNL